MNTLMKLFVALVVLGGIAYWIWIPIFERSNIYFPEPQIESDPSILGISFEDVSFRATDGVPLTGWWVPAPPAQTLPELSEDLEPAQTAETPVPGTRGTVLFLHGNAGNISHRLAQIHLLHNLGLHLFIIDYRGYGASTGHPDEQGLYRDALGALNYLKTRPEVDPDRLVYYGESLGGAVATDLAVRQQPQVLILEAAFLSLPVMAKRVYPWIPSWLVRSRYDNLSKIGRIRCPTQIFHSRGDEIVPVQDGERLFETCTAPTKEFVPLEGDHNDAFMAHIGKIEMLIDQFLTEAGLSR
ncbi:MAG: alpha/beta hydrolase [Candidatus Omnitrophica bacterium]|nr:alpha/beta hydrolase [Candidatus Omnitrophota bacterium]